MVGGKPWTEEDNVKLRSLAGTKKAHEIAVNLGRSVAATIVQASKLKISMSTRRSAVRHNQQAEGAKAAREG